MALSPRDHLPWRQRLVPLAAVAAAKLLARCRPRRIRIFLQLARRGARPATNEQAQQARQAVVSVSLLCAGQYCLQRSLAAALLCRARGTWPTWCTGVRTNPFAAHAWIEVDGQPIGEPYPAGHYRTLLAVPPTTSQPPAQGGIPAAQAPEGCVNGH